MIDMDESRYFGVPVVTHYESILYFIRIIHKTKRINTMGIKGRVDKMVVLACETCKERNYTTVKNKKVSKERMELNKYCPSCQKHTAHKETK